MTDRLAVCVRRDQAFTVILQARAGEVLEALLGASDTKAKGQKGEKKENEGNARKRGASSDGHSSPKDPKMPRKMDEKVEHKGGTVRFKGHKWVVRIPRVAAKNGKEFSVDRVVGDNQAYAHSFFNQTNTFRIL